MTRFSMRLATYPQGIDDLLDVIRQMFVSTESALSPGLTSAVEAVTEAVLVINPAWVGRTTMSIVAVPPFAIVPRVQVTTPLACTQLPWLGAAET